MGLRAELFDFLVELPACDSPEERRSLITNCGGLALARKLVFEGSNDTFWNGLLNFFGQGKKLALVDFLQKMGNTQGIGFDRKEILAKFPLRFDALDDGTWQSEFYPISTRLTTRLPEAQFRELLEIVASVTIFSQGDALFRIYRAMLPASAYVLNNATHSQLLNDLCERPLIKSWPPLLEFIERLVLVDGLEANLQTKLRHWVDASAALIMPPTPSSEINLLRQALREERELAKSNELSWLQVYLEPDPLNRTLDRKVPVFMVELVLWSPLTNGALVLQSEPSESDSGEARRFWPLDELRFLLDQVFARPEIVSLIPDSRRLVIEIVAPSDVLLYGFDRWKRNNTVNSYGVFYPLVVRLQDRLTIPYAADQKLADELWRKKWNVFRNRLCHRKCEDLEWMAHQDLDVFKLQDDSELACLGLSSPLSIELRSFFEVLRDAGIPIAIWLRSGDVGTTALADWPHWVNSLLRGKQLSELREAVWEVRRTKEARTDEKHVGNSVTLLWDQPDRLPLKYANQGVFV